jgi:hypothetical protein
VDLKQYSINIRGLSVIYFINLSMHMNALPGEIKPEILYSVPAGNCSDSCPCEFAQCYVVMQGDADHQGLIKALAHCAVH